MMESEGPGDETAVAGQEDSGVPAQIGCYHNATIPLLCIDNLLSTVGMTATPRQREHQFHHTTVARTSDKD
jgi:hypothetical protein